MQNRLWFLMRALRAGYRQFGEWTDHAARLLFLLPLILPPVAGALLYSFAHVPAGWAVGIGVGLPVLVLLEGAYQLSESNKEPTSAVAVDPVALREHLTHMQDWATRQIPLVADLKPVWLNLDPPSKAFAFHFPHEHSKLVAYESATRTMDIALTALRHRAHQESDALNLGLVHFGREVFAWVAEEAINGGYNFDPTSMLSVEKSESVPAKWVLRGASNRGGYQGGWLLPLSPHLDSHDEVVHRYLRPISVSLGKMATWEELDQTRNAHKGLDEPMRAALDALGGIKFKVAIKKEVDCPSCP